MVRWNRFGHSQAWRPMLRGGWVKKARTNKPNKECGRIWSTAPTAVFRASAQGVAVSGGASNRESLFSSLAGGCCSCAGNRVRRLGVVRAASKTVAAPYSKCGGRPPLFVLAPRVWLGCGGRSTGGVSAFYGDEPMVRWNRFGHSQAGRPTLRGGWVKTARTNKPKKEWGSIWSTAPSAVFRASAQGVAVSGGTSNRKSLFSSLVGERRSCAGDRVLRLGVVRPASKTVAAPYSKSGRPPPLFANLEYGASTVFPCGGSWRGVVKTGSCTARRRE
jgi:hypothetical protein